MIIPSKNDNYKVIHYGNYDIFQLINHNYHSIINHNGFHHLLSSLLIGAPVFRGTFMNNKKGRYLLTAIHDPLTIPTSLNVTPSAQ